MNTKKIILSAFITALFSGQSIASYQVKYGRNQIDGDNIKFIDTGKWLSADPIVSSWSNNGEPTGCGSWIPLENTVSYGVSFKQTANNCQQEQTRTVQQREQNNVTHAYRNVGVIVVENNTLSNQTINRTATGALIKWSAASPITSEWVNSGVATGCTNWTPDPSTFDIGVTFTQNATDCKQLQTRTVQNREQNDSTQEYRNVGSPTTENQTLSNQPNSRPATGTKTLDECSYVYGSTAVMSAWIDNDANKDIEVWWKGTKIIATTPSVIVTTYTIGGFKYQRTGSYIRRDVRSSNSWYRYYQICRSPI